MKLFVKIAVIILMAALLGACAAPQVQAPAAEKPEWLWKPSENGKIGGVGIAKEHIRGVDEQRKLAVSRAIDSIAAQLGVTVKNITTIKAHADNSGSSTVQDSYSIHTVQGNTVRATIKEFWLDSSTGELYVWMVSE
jgi:type IV pilus biogenesis protein CpaD/CtpE